MAVKCCTNWCPIYNEIYEYKEDYIPSFGQRVYQVWGSRHDACALNIV